ncbi:MAG TPA: DNA-binding protein [Lactobacillus sp.]|nr:DNA-binding protein [Lactobacillus sp.]
MHDLLGRVIETKVTDQNDDYYIVQRDGFSFQFDKKEADHKLGIGAQITGFAYENEEHDYQITTTIPKTQIGHYAFGTVVRSAHGLGVFVDVGLPNKDFVVSVDELPTIAGLMPQKGDRLMVSLVVDAKNRLWAHLADAEIFTAISRRATNADRNHDLTGTVYRLKLAGTLLLTDDYYLGFVHPSERDHEPRLGEQVKGRVIGVRPDGGLNISLKPRAYQAISEDAAQLLAALDHEATHSLPFTDMSSPDAIKAYFGISKGQFKRAVGHLLKARYIEQAESGITLTETGIAAANAQ